MTTDTSDGTPSSELHFQRLDVYRLAVAFAVGCDAVNTDLPAGRGYIRDQLRRAALSVVNNIAEGAGEFSTADKARFYRMALRSTTECAATLDVIRGVDAASSESVEALLRQARRLVAMLTRLVARMRQRGAGGNGNGAREVGTGRGTGTGRA